MLLLYKKCLLVLREKEWVNIFRIGTVVMDEGKMLIYVKGASEIILESCVNL